MPTTPQKINRQENAFDFLRLVAALTVVVFHSLEWLGGSVLWVQAGDRAWFYDGVPMFFIISGYLVYGSAIRCKERGRSMWDFGLNRFLRIVPALIVWGIVVGILFAVTGYYAPNGSLWTIPAESSFYATLPLVLLLTWWLGWRRTLPLLLVIAAIGMGLGIAYDLTDSRGVLFLLLYTFVPWTPHFLLGMLWWRYQDRIPLRGTWALVALVLYVGLRSFDIFGLSNRLSLEYIGLLPLSYLIMYAAFRAPKFLLSPLPIGDLSYGTYIWHMFVIDIIMHFELGWPTWTVVPVSLALAALSWFLIEKPALNLKRYSLLADLSAKKNTRGVEQSFQQSNPNDA